MPRLPSFVALAASMALIAPAPASAVTYDKLAYLTFSAPVQIPGATLDAGTYRFRLTNPDTSRNVLQVLSYDGDTIYAMFHTIPDRRMFMTEDPFVTFREVPADVPPALKSLFYGGEYKGYEFVYPEGWPITVAKVIPQPPITYMPRPVVAAPEPIAEPPLQPAAPVPVAMAPAPVEALPQAAPVELPRTASLLPFIAAGGLMSLLLGVGIGLIRRRTGDDSA